MANIRTYKKGTFERFVLTCPMGDTEKLWEKVDKMGLSMIRGGPKRLSGLKIDVSTYYFVGERRIDDER
jgi:hypothetical protein